MDWIEIYENEAGAFGPVTILRPSAAQRTVEFHLESGFASTAQSLGRGFFMNSDCQVSIFWTGYTAN